MSDSLSRSTEIRHAVGGAIPPIEGTALDAGDSLDTFRSESLDAFPSEYHDGGESPAADAVLILPSGRPSVFACISAPPICETAYAPYTPSKRHRRRSALRRTGDAIGRRSVRVAAVTMQSALRVRFVVGASAARAARRTPIVIAVLARFAVRLRSGLASVMFSVRGLLWQAAAAFRSSVVALSAGVGVRLRATVWSVAPRLRRVTEERVAAFRRALATLTSSVMGRLRIIVPSVAERSREIAVPAVAVCRRDATALRARVASGLRVALRSAAVISGRIVEHAPAILGRARPMLHRRLAMGMMFALMVVAGTYGGYTNMSARRPLTSPATIATPNSVVAPLVSDLLPTRVTTPLDGPRSSMPQFTPSIAPRQLITPPVTVRTRLDTRAIQAVLNRYRDAVSTLDVSAVRAVWPSADVGAVRKQFASLEEQNLEFDGCRISSAAAGATASCAGTLESGFAAGNRRPRLERKRWQFTLRKVGQRWMITAVGTERG